MFKETGDPQEALRTRDVMMPALLVLAQADRIGAEGVTSAQVEQALESALPLSSMDREKQEGRSSRFSRTVRNTIVSHQTLEKQGLARRLRASEANPLVRLRITAKGQSLLCDHMLDMLSESLPTLESLAASEPTPRVVEGAARMGEAELVNLAVLVLALAQKANEDRPVGTTLLRRAIKTRLQVSPEDAQVLAGRRDTKIDQILRNLLGSHDALTRFRFATRNEEGLAITAKGKAHLLNTVLLASVPAPPSIRSAAPSAAGARRPRP